MVNGVPAFRASLKKKGQAAVQAAEAAARKGGEQVAADMRNLVPVDERHLLNSIRVEDQAERVGVVVKAGDAMTKVTNSRGVVFDNARIQEFGTKTRAANPYFFPAWRINRTRVRAAISRAVRKAWRS